MEYKRTFIAIELKSFYASVETEEEEVNHAYDDIILICRTTYRSVIYCRSGRRSANAAGKLADVGYKCVNLKGGILAWKDAGKPVVTE